LVRCRVAVRCVAAQTDLRALATDEFDAGGGAMEEEEL
jgi:hypothetical protein